MKICKGQYVFWVSCFIVLQIYPAVCHSQDSMYIPENAVVSFFEKDTVAIFSSVIHAGTLLSKQGNYVILYGKDWQNRNGARILDGAALEGSSAGGSFEFRQPNSLSGIHIQQRVDAGFDSRSFSGTGFSAIVLNNSKGLLLLSDLNVVKDFSFSAGHVYLNGRSAVIGNPTDPGTISGYTENAFFVTRESIGGGYLILRNVQLGKECVFPIGAKATPERYDPISIKSSSVKEDISVNSFSNTYSGANTGILISDSSINTTWLIKKTNLSPNNYTIRLQYNLQNEGWAFSKYKSNSYISMFERDQWHDASLLHEAPQMPGVITSGNPIYSAAINSTLHAIGNVDSFYLTMFAGPADIDSKDINIPNVFTPNGDGQNDFLDISGIQKFPDNEVVIYNRWGNEIFKTKGYSGSNRFTGNGFPDGTYFYIVRILAQGVPKIYKGYTTIIR